MSRRCANDAASSLLRQSPIRRSCGRTIARCVAAPTPCQQRPARVAYYYSTEPRKEHVAVVGGGLTGLTAAYYLAKELPPTTQITLYEGSGRLGGWIWTDNVPVSVAGVTGNVAFERGPRSFTSLSRDTRRYDDLVLYNLILDLGLKLYSPPDRPRFIYYPDHLVRVPPMSLLDVFTEPLLRSAIWPAFKGMAAYYRQKESYASKVPKHDMSIADWLAALTGSRTIGDNLISAMVHGIHGGDITKLSARSALDGLYWRVHSGSGGPDAYVMEKHEHDLMQKLGSDPMVRALALEKRGSMMHFGTAGMNALPNALEAALREAPNVTIKLNSPVRNIAPGNDDGTVNVLSTEKSPAAYNRVISTMLAEPLSKITNNTLPSLAKTSTVSIMTVNVWFPLENIKPAGLGYLIPRGVPEEQNPEGALGVFFDSDVGAGAADEPKGTKLFVLMGGHYYDGVTPPTEEEALEQAKAVLERHLGIPRDTPRFAMARLARDCIPQHVVGHRERMNAAHEELETAFDGRLTVAGGSYTRPGALSGIRAGYDAAMNVIDGKRTTGLEGFDHVPNEIAVSQEYIRVRNFHRRP